MAMPEALLGGVSTLLFIDLVENIFKEPSWFSQSVSVVEVEDNCVLEVHHYIIYCTSNL